METLQNPIEVIDIIAQPVVTPQVEALAKPFGTVGVMEEVDGDQFTRDRFATCTLTGVPADDIGNETGKK